jgi:hypothetical protein
MWGSRTCSHEVQSGANQKRSAKEDTEKSAVAIIMKYRRGMSVTEGNVWIRLRIVSDMT